MKISDGGDFCFKPDIKTPHMALTVHVDIKKKKKELG